MELRQLHYFVVLAHRLHFTQAAEELAIVQPALSQQIKPWNANLAFVCLSECLVTSI